MPNSSPRREPQPSRKWSQISLLLLLFAGFCYWQGLSGLIPGSTDSAQATLLHPRIEKRLVTAPIGSLRLGQRIIAENPQLAGVNIPNVDPDPVVTRQVSLFGPMGDGWFMADCLFTLDEIEQLGLIEGETVDFSVSHIELDKPLLVTAIRACPEFEPDDGTGRRVVTAIYRHLARDLIDVQIEGEEKPIGCTPGHPFWSVNRDEFIPAKDLRPGEWVKTAYERTSRVISLSPRGPPSADGQIDTAEVVINLEVAGQHVYHVGASGVLVHNGCGAGGLDDITDASNKTLTHRNGIYEILSEQPISGVSRSAHRASANGNLLNQLQANPNLNRHLSKYLEVDDLAKQMKSGKSGLLNPRGAEWHHPIDNPNIMILLRKVVHREEDLQRILHPGPNRSGGFRNNF